MRAKKNWHKAFFDPAFYNPASPAACEHAPREAVFAAKALGARKGFKILDVACGPGRHSLELAHLGYKVTGLDFCKAYLDEARTLAKKHRLAAEFILGDMRDIPFAAEFDAVICMFTSFGYFSKAEDLNTLKSMARALKPGGKLLLDVIDADHFRGPASGRDWCEQEDGSFVLDEWRMDIKKSATYNCRTLLQPGKKPMAREFWLNVYNRSLLEGLLTKAGLKSLRFYNGFGKMRKGNRLIALAVKN